MKNKKVPKDQLSIDMETNDRHKWKLGEWERIVIYKQRIDTCTICGCRRVMINYFAGNLRKTITEVSSYVRSGVSLPAKPAPACWGANNPK